MKKVIAGLVLTLALSSMGMAAVQPPLDQRGNALYTADWVGVKTCVIAGSTGTNAVSCATGRGIVYGVIISSPQILTGEGFAAMRDSGTANTTSSSFTLVGTQTNGTTQVLPNATVMQTFPRPLQFTNGLSVNVTITPQTGELWTILYRPTNATE